MNTNKIIDMINDNKNSYENNRDNIKNNETKVINNSAPKTNSSWIQKFGVNIGTGVCNIFNKIRQQSDSYENSYESMKQNGEKPSLYQIGLNIANKTLRISGNILSGFGNAVKTVAKSDEIKEIGSGIKSGYQSIRENYKNALGNFAEKVKAETDEIAASGEKAGFAVKFKSFISSMANSIESAYSKGENVVGKTAGKISESVKSIGSEIKKSDAYSQLIHAREQSDKETNTKSTEIQFN